MDGRFGSIVVPQARSLVPSMPFLASRGPISAPLLLLLAERLLVVCSFVRGRRFCPVAMVPSAAGRSPGICREVLNDCNYPLTAT